MIREALPSDYINMDSVFRESAKKLCISHYSIDVIESWAGDSWPERFEKGTEEGNQHYVTVIDETIVCFGSINIEKQLLVSLFVKPDYAGHGLGNKMMKFLFELAKSKNIRSLKLDSSLNAVNFYRRNGFREVGRSDYETTNGVIMKSVQMECRL